MQQIYKQCLAYGLVDVDLNKNNPHKKPGELPSKSIFPKYLQDPQYLQKQYLKLIIALVRVLEELQQKIVILKSTVDKILC
jgi:hypothetical protein